MFQLFLSFLCSHPFFRQGEGFFHFLKIKFYFLVLGSSLNTIVRVGLRDNGVKGWNYPFLVIFFYSLVSEFSIHIVIVVYSYFLFFTNPF